MPTRQQIGWDEDSAQFLNFRLKDSLFGVPVEQVLRIEHLAPATPVPNAPDFLEGVINVKGDIVPLLDLQKRLRIGRGVGNDPRARVIIVEAGDEIVGMIVDAVIGIERLPLASIEPPPPMVADINGVFLTGVARTGGDVLILLSLSHILSLDELDEVGRLRASAQKDSPS